MVASEVKSLAVQTAKATEEISGQIAAVQSSTSGAVEAIRGITARMQEINQHAAAVAGAVEAQRAATAEISRNVAERGERHAQDRRILGELTSAAASHRQVGAHRARRIADRSKRPRSSLGNEVEGFLKKVAS